MNAEGADGETEQTDPTNFNILFQLVLTKFFKSKLFSFLPKVGHLIKSCKEPIGPTTELV